MSRRPIRALGEIALRVTNLDASSDFYEHVIGLELMRRFPSSSFFRIAEGFAGHTAILALFDRSAQDGYVPPEPANTTVDHIAFTISLEDFAHELQRLRGLGLVVETTEHAWVAWRSMYVKDPDGNSVELVCHDPSLKS